MSIILMCHRSHAWVIACTVMHLGLMPTSLLAQCEPREIAKVLASDGALGAGFGASVAISGPPDNTLAIIGAPSNYGNGSYSGAAYIFRGDDGGWAQVDRLIPSDGQMGDVFGHSVAISGDIAIVGAPYDDDNGNRSGAAYIFRDNGNGNGSWIQIDKITASDGAANDLFGGSIAISRLLGTNIAIIGAPQDDDNGLDSGSAYIYRDEGKGSWTEITKITPTDATDNDRFGYGLATSGDKLIIGAYRGDGRESGSGAAYIFRNEGDGNLIELAKLSASDGASGDLFGVTAAISSNPGRELAVVGAVYDADNGFWSGSAYVFVENDGDWTQVAKIMPSDGEAMDFFGSAVAISGETAIIGAQFDNDRGHEAGSAYLFRDEGGGKWVEIAEFAASDVTAGDRFGASVAASDQTVIFGAPHDDDNGNNSGSAYIFELDCSCPADFNEDGIVNGDDFAAYLAAFTQREPSADLNGDGTVDTLDFLAFLNAFSVGC